MLRDERHNRRRLAQARRALDECKAQILDQRRGYDVELALVALGAYPLRRLSVAEFVSESSLVRKVMVGSDGLHQPAFVRQDGQGAILAGRRDGRVARRRALRRSLRVDVH